MQHDYSQMLLLDNDLYLEAVQHRRIELAALGLQELKYDFGSRRNTSGKKRLKAVIPIDDQKVFLQKAGVLHDTFQTIPEAAPQPKPHIRYRKLRKDLEKESKEKSGAKKSTKVTTQSADSAFVAHPARRTSIGGTPLYQKESETHKQMVEREKQEAIERNKKKEWLTKMGTNFDIIGADGAKYVYDDTGRLVAEHIYLAKLEEIEREKSRRSHQEPVPPHSTEIIEKTKKFVEDLRKRVWMVSCLFPVLRLRKMIHQSVLSMPSLVH